MTSKKEKENPKLIWEEVNEIISALQWVDHHQLFL